MVSKVSHREYRQNKISVFDKKKCRKSDSSILQCTSNLCFFHHTHASKKNNISKSSIYLKKNNSNKKQCLILVEYITSFTLLFYIHVSDHISVVGILLKMLVQRISSVFFLSLYT